MTDEEKALARFVAEGGTTTNRKKPHIDWDEVILKHKKIRKNTDGKKETNND